MHSLWLHVSAFQATSRSQGELASLIKYICGFIFKFNFAGFSNEILSRSYVSSSANLFLFFSFSSLEQFEILDSMDVTPLIVF